jgi:hypothetical protein
LFVCLFVCLFACLFVCLFASLFVCLCVCKPLLLVFPCSLLPMRSFVVLVCFVCLFVCLFVCCLLAWWFVCFLRHVKHRVVPHEMIRAA